MAAGASAGSSPRLQGGSFWLPPEDGCLCCRSLHSGRSLRGTDGDGESLPPRPSSREGCWRSLGLPAAWFDSLRASLSCLSGASLPHLQRILLFQLDACPQWHPQLGTLVTPGRILGKAALDPLSRKGRVATLRGCPSPRSSSLLKSYSGVADLDLAGAMELLWLRSAVVGCCGWSSPRAAGAAEPWCSSRRAAASATLFHKGQGRQLWSAKADAKEQMIRACCLAFCLRLCHRGLSTRKTTGTQDMHH